MKFSIVTPTYNQADFLERTILSVINQVGVEYEYVIIDGKSRDNTVSIIRKYEEKLRHWESEEDRGQSHAINKGFSLATGDIFAYLNSDDVYTANALSYVKKMFEDNPEVDVVYGDCGYMDSNDVVFRVKKAPQFSKSHLYKKNFIFQPATFFRRRIYEKIGPLDERYHFCMDYEYWIRMAKNAAVFRRLPMTLACMRFHDLAKSVAKIQIALNEERAMKLEYGFAWWEVQSNYLYKKFIGRYMWPLKRQLAYQLHQYKILR